MKVSPTFSYNVRGFQVDPGWSQRPPKKFSPTAAPAVDKMSIRKCHNFFKFTKPRRKIQLPIVIFIVSVSKSNEIRKERDIYKSDLFL